MPEADVDGAHIRKLLLSFFYKEMKQLIDAGYIYIAQPPLFRVSKGKEEFYAYDEKERDTYVKRPTHRPGSKSTGSGRPHKRPRRKQPPPPPRPTQDPPPTPPP